MTKSSTSPALQKALNLLRCGEEQGADDLLVKHKDEVLRQFGPQSREYGQALFDHGYFCISQGNMEHGIAFLSEAIKVVPRDEQTWHLLGSISYQLGSALNYEGRFTEAQPILIECINARQRAFGADHLERWSATLELAECLSGQNRFAEAHQHLQSACEKFFENRDVLAFEALAIKCLVDIYLNAPTPELKHLSKLSDDDLDALLEQFKSRLQHYPLNAQLAALERLTDGSLELGAERIGFKLSLLEEVGVLACNGGYHKQAEIHINKFLGLASDAGMPEKVVWALIFLTDLLIQSGQFDRAEETILFAMEEAEHAKSDRLLADATRVYGKLLAAISEPTEAERNFRLAVELATRSKSTQAVASCRGDLAIFIHHQGRYQEAHTMIKTLMRELDVDGCNLSAVQDHLDALNEEYSCGCFADPDIDAIMDEVGKNVDPDYVLCDLIASLGIDRSYKIDVQLSRTATPREKEMLDAYCAGLVSELKRQRKLANTNRLNQLKK